MTAETGNAGWHDNSPPLPTLLLALALTCLQACTSHSPVDHQPSADQPHLLADAVWDTGNARFIDLDELESATARADYLLLGEVHDNPRHHALQARLIASFGGAPNTVAVGFEQLTQAQAEPMTHYLLAHPDDAAGLGTAVDWENSGWPEWSLYQPIFQQALNRGWQPLPLMFNPDNSMAILEQGYGAVLGKQALAALQPDTALSPGEQAEVEALMHTSHCGKLPASMLPGMVRIQVAKDAYMAWVAAGTSQRGVLIVGDGHARKDRGIPLFLRRAAPGKNIVVVSMVEVEPGLVTPADYPQVNSSLSDFIVFTIRQERGDPCASISGIATDQDS